MNRIYRAAMVTGLIFGSVALANTAIACSGTTAYPAAAKALEQSTLSADKRAALMSKFNQGYATHQQGHAENSGAKMMESLKILGEVKAEMAK